jgi:methionyl-tRNA formyltransferase
MPLRIVLFLNGDRGLRVLKALAREGNDTVVAVVTPPGFDTTRLADASVSPIGVHLPIANVNSPAAHDTLRLLAPDVFVVGGYSTILTPSTLELPTWGTLNLHAGRLPDYRGGSPLNWQILNGESHAGVSVIKADAGIDTGPIMTHDLVPIGPLDTIAELHEEVNRRFPGLVLAALRAIEAGAAPPRPQDNAGAVYWHQRNDDDGRLRFAEQTADAVDRMIRALSRPYPGAWAMVGESRVRLFRAEVPAFTLRGVPGRVCFIQGRGPYVVCRDRAVLITDYASDSTSAVPLKHGQHLT